MDADRFTCARIPVADGDSILGRVNRPASSFSVVDFGAVGDGSADDSPAFRAAMAQAAASDGLLA